MNSYDKILKAYHNSVLNEGKEENKEKDGPEYKAFFKKTLKKFGVTEPDQLKGDKKKEFYDAIDKGWKADKETDVDGSKLDESVGGRLLNLFVELNSWAEDLAFNPNDEKKLFTAVNQLKKLFTGFAKKNKLSGF